jgi:acetyl-CoA acetyltransferase
MSEAHTLTPMPATVRTPLRDGREVYVLGVGMHPFGKHGVPLRDQAFTAGMAALKDSGARFRDVGALYTGYIGGKMMEGVTYAKDFGLTGIPVVRVENASATGSCAFREACLQVAGGASDVAMALGFDDLGRMSLGSDQRGKSTEKAGSGKKDAAPADKPARPRKRPSMEALIVPAGFFAMWAVRRMHDNGTTAETYAKIAAKNWNHARFNPMAQRQAANEVTAEQVLASDMVAYPHTVMMACASGAGAACAIVGTREWAEKVAAGRPLVKGRAAQLQSERYAPGHIFMGALVGPSDLTRTTAEAAYEEAGIGPDDLSLVHVHDAFPVEELMYYELLGLCGPGEGDRLVAEGATALGGRIPFSTDGGLIARGHPGGPTGLAQIWDTTQQLRGESGKRQVDGARLGLAHMMGAGSVCTVHVLERTGR